jgi:hypothetical protein
MAATVVAGVGATLFLGFSTQNCLTPSSTMPRLDLMNHLQNTQRTPTSVSKTRGLARAVGADSGPVRIPT